ncbi:hypothetical protein CLAIMM_04344 [Cladophialophora immunda]|nr:hypothetical protein CLAIMM_04344 [Cladophialophora immunda]
MPYNPTSFNAVCAPPQGRSAPGTFNRTISYWSSMPSEEEIPTFVFGQPAVDQINTAKTPQPRIAANGKQTPVLWACGGYAPDRSEVESETEYDPATKAHFRRHLGIIDCSGAARSQDLTGREASNPALLDYQMQLRLLDEQNRRRLKEAKDVQRIDAQR